MDINDFVNPKTLKTGTGVDIVYKTVGGGSLYTPPMMLVDDYDIKDWSPVFTPAVVREFNMAIGYKAITGPDTRNTLAIGNHVSPVGDNVIQIGNSDQRLLTYNEPAIRSDPKDMSNVTESTIGIDFIKDLKTIKYKPNFRDGKIEELFPFPHPIVEPVEPIKGDYVIQVDEDEFIFDDEKYGAAKAIYDKKLKAYNDFKDGVIETIKQRKTYFSKVVGDRPALRYVFGFDTETLVNAAKAIDADFNPVFTPENGYDLQHFQPTQLLAPIVKSLQELNKILIKHGLQLVEHEEQLVVIEKELVVIQGTIVAIDKRVDGVEESMRKMEEAFDSALKDLVDDISSNMDSMKEEMEKSINEAVNSIPNYDDEFSEIDKTLAELKADNRLDVAEKTGGLGLRKPTQMGDNLLLALRFGADDFMTLLKGNGIYINSNLWLHLTADGTRILYAGGWGFSPAEGYLNLGNSRGDWAEGEGGGDDDKSQKSMSRWTGLYAIKDSNILSDARIKTQTRLPEEREKLAALEIKNTISLYKLRSAVKDKGDEARWHCGVIAQTVVAILEKYDLDPFSYSFIGKSDYDTVTVNKDNSEPILNIRPGELIMFILAAL